MSKICLGLDIGENSAKLALIKDRRIKRLCVSPLADGLPRENGRLQLSDALAAELRACLRREHIAIRECALVLPAGSTYVRRVTLPWMTAKQLKVNLPYEFHDYLEKDKELYYYDYALVGEKKDPLDGSRQIDLLAATTEKKLIADYRAMLKKAGLRLASAVPESLVYRSLIRAFEENHSDSHPREYCFVDMGHHSIRVHIYRDGEYETSHVIDYGGETIRKAADAAEAENIAGAPPAQSVQDLYNDIAIEILRAVNFYGFNTPGSNLEDVYLTGGLATTPGLIDTIRDYVKLSIHSAADLLPPDGMDKQAELCVAAAGAALEQNGG